MNKLRTRLAFDAVLTALLAFEMFYEVTGDTLHEIVGVAFFATIVAHLVLSRKWIGATAKAVSNGKRMKPMATARMVLGILLAISMVVLMASSVAISNLLAGAGVDLAGAAYGTWALVHTVSSYALCCLVVAHLGIHWASIASAFKIPYNPERRAAIGTGVTALGALGVAAIGLAGYKTVAIPASAAVTDTATTENSKSESRSKSKSKSNSSSGTVTGTCTLCRKNCPLSAPKCDKPYEAGLL
ncbi:MAG: DUF4405 domain-containing protein [Eggerthellaceae bacterium]|nr:DUF4405 domain-containing protein [Eggerthellaceae bacterium]